MNKFYVLALIVVLALCGEASAGTIRMAYLPLWVAQDRHFFEQEGVSVEIAGVFRAGPEIMTAFSAGALDMAYVGEAPATIAFARGNRTIHLLAQVNTEGSALVVGVESSIGSMKDLKNRTVAVPGNGSVQDFLLRRNLEREGVAAADVRILTIAPSEMSNALHKGQIDAYIAWQPYPSRTVLAGEGRILADSSALWAGHPCCALMAAKSVPAEDARAVLRAHRRAVEDIRAHPDEAVRTAVQHTGMDEAVVREALAHVVYTTEPSLSGEEEYVRFLNTLGYIKVQDSAAFIADFIDTELLRSVQ